MHVAIDLGAESGRVIVGDLKNIEVIHRFASKRVEVNGHLYWDILAIFSEIKEGLRMAFREYGQKIKSIGIDSWGVDYVLLDKNDCILGNPFHYRDNRNDGIMEELRELLGDRQLYDSTGVQFLPFNTIYQLYEEKKNRSERLAVAESFLTISDILNFWLSGVKANEFSLATTTQLYNPLKKSWDFDLISELGLPAKIFQKVVPSGTILGQLLPELEKELGAPSGVKIIAPACHDTGSAVAAVPASGEKDFAYLSSGTWSLLGLELDEALISQATMEANFSNEGGADGGSRFLKNIMGLWILQECRKEWVEGDEPISYGKIVELAEESGEAPVTIDVDDPKYLKPGNASDTMSKRIQSDCWDSKKYRPESIGQIARVVIDSLALRYAENLELAAKLTDRDINCLYIIGGGSKNSLLSQMTANATGIEVQAGLLEATALGNILLQQIACGEISSLNEGRRIIGESWSIETYRPR